MSGKDVINFTLFNMTMLNSLKETGKNLGRELGRAWENLSEGWHELLSRSSSALTPFTRHKDTESASDTDTGTAPTQFPRWSLLAGELEETEKDVLVRVELPGMDKADCQISIEGNVLHLRGEKRFERETSDSVYHVMERAYGVFHRAIPLPRHVNINRAEASFKNGVLLVRLPKEGTAQAKSITVS